MRVAYYADTDSLYIDLSSRSSAESLEVVPGIVIDFDIDGNVVGIDIDHATKFVDLDELTLTTLLDEKHLPAA